MMRFFRKFRMAKDKPKISKFNRDMTIQDERAFDAMKLAECARDVNAMIRRTVDAGLLERAACTEDEVRSLHRMRSLLADYYGTHIADFENPEWLLENEISGESR